MTRKSWVRCGGILWMIAMVGGVVLGQTTAPVQQAKDTPEPTLPLPRDKHGAAIEGACDVSLVVNEAGRPQKIHVVHCTDKRLKDYAEFSVAGYKFIPAKQNGRAVSAQMMIEVSAHKPAPTAQPVHVVDPTMPVHVADPPPLRAQTGSDDDPIGVENGPQRVRPPQLTYGPPALYSIGARRKGRTCPGVMISLTVTKTGGVKDILLMDSCPDLDDSALEAVRNYRFKPATLDGQPVAVRIKVKVAFSIHFED